MTQRNLRSLPQEMQPPYGWDEFQRRAQDRVQATALRRSNFRVYAAIAAALVLVVVAIATWTRVARPGASQPVTAQEDPAHVPVPSSDLASDSLASVDPHAVTAEHLLASLPSDPVVVRVGTRAAVAGLEDRIAQLDDLLSAARAEGAQPERVAEMQQQRDLLVRSLWQVRYAEVLVADSR